MNGVVILIFFLILPLGLKQVLRTIKAKLQDDVQPGDAHRH